jgi:hypothetical protein
MESINLGAIACGESGVLLHSMRVKAINPQSLPQNSLPV